MKKSSYENFKEYEVKCNSLEEFLEKYTQRSKHRGRGDDYVNIRIQSHQNDLDKYGFTFVTRHDSVTGDTVSYYGQREEK